MNTLSLVMPMAGRGSRFAKLGITEPKPLVNLFGRPFFWWATESVRRAAPVGEMAFVVLDEHVRDFSIDRRIREFYPDAQVVAIPEVTSGAAETARLGVEAISGEGPIAVNDCDHAFLCPDLPRLVEQLANGAASGLVCFRSQSPAYSYVRLDGAGAVTGTVEKQVVSPFAIAGCYLFESAATFKRHYSAYREDCPYDELFVSGLANLMTGAGERVVMAELAYHGSFGTPEEQGRLDMAEFQARLPWLDRSA